MVSLTSVMKELLRLTILLSCGLTGCQTAGIAPWLEARWFDASTEAGSAQQETGEPSGAIVDRRESKTQTALRDAGESGESSIALAAHQQPAEEVVPAEEPEIPSPQELLTFPGRGAPGGELRLADLEQIALNNNPALAEAWARVRAAEGRWLQAGLPPNTELGYSGQQIGSRGLAEQDGVYMRQNLVRLRKLRLNRLVAAQEINVTRQQAQVQQQRLLTDVRLGFYEMLVAQRRVDLTRELVHINQGAVEIATSLFNAQEVGRPDVLRATIQLQSSQLGLRAAENQYRAAWSKLAAVLGTPDASPQRIAGSLEVEFGSISEEDAMAQILEFSPELAAALAEVDRAEFAVQRQRVEPVPNLDVQGIVQHDNSTGSSNGALQVSFPIPWINRNQGGIRAAEAEVVAAQRAVARTQLSLKRRLASVYQRYATARVKVAGYTGPEGILANVKASLEAVRENYEAVEISYIDLLNAQRTYAQQNLAYIETIGELWAAVTEINGLLLKDSLDSPPQ
jgi:cobalt-zinc-cadmium efflux system outer membrane protein